MNLIRTQTDLRRVGLTLCLLSQQLRESLPISSQREEEIQEEEKETVLLHPLLVLMFHRVISHLQ